MKDLNGKVAFVTGGGEGIGLAIARHLARAGMQVALGDVDQGALDRAAAKFREDGSEALTVIADVADLGAMEKAAATVADRFGKVHLLCNNAGVAVGGPAAESTEADWDWVMGVNLGGIVNGLAAFLPLILAHGEGGHIVNTASVAGLMATPGLSVYTASKFAAVGYSETLRLELAEEGIGVSVLCPGFVRTRIHESGRNRPDRFGGALPADAPAGGATLREHIETGLDPDQVGGLVVAAVRANEFFILTHPGLKPWIEERHDQLMQAFDVAAARLREV